MTIRLLLFVPLLALAACSNAVPDKYRFTKGDAATGALYAHQPRTEYEILEEVPAEGTGSATRIPETKKAYAVRRYIDPVNKRILHERGVIYRVEEDARWNLSGTPRDRTLLGPVVGVREPHYVAAPLGAEMSSELSKQKALTKTLTTSVQNLAENPDRTNAGERLVQAAGRIEDGQKKILTKVQAIDGDVNALRVRVDSLENTNRSPNSTPQPKAADSPTPAPSSPQPKDNGLEPPKPGVFDFLKR